MKNTNAGRRKRTVVRDETLKWKRVTRGLIQESVLAPILLVSVNDKPLGINDYIKVLAGLQKSVKCYIWGKREKT